MEKQINERFSQEILFSTLRTISKIYIDLLNVFAQQLIPDMFLMYL